MPKRDPSNRPVYKIRGRVGSAIFNCPVCAAAIRYVRKTGYRIRCPNRECRQPLQVALRVMICSRVGTYDRPADTILPANPMPAEELPLPAGTPDSSVEPFDDVPLESWTPGEPFHRVDREG